MGTVFSVPAGGGNITVLASLNFTSGGNPTCGLTLSGNTLYGATTTGGLGSGSDATVFSLPVIGGNITTLATFNGTNGFAPYCNLILSGGNLYGTTAAGGADNDGTVFSVPMAGGNVTTLASFNGTNGNGPECGLVMDASGNLYGTATFGGASDDGVVFSLPITGGTPTDLVSFNRSTTGDFCVAGLVSDASGNLYDVTGYDGPGGWGTLFKLSPAVPEPASLSLLAVGGIGMLARRRRK